VIHINDNYINWNIFESELNGPIFVLLTDLNGNVLRYTNNTPKCIINNRNIFRTFKGLKEFVDNNKRMILDEVFDTGERSQEKIRVVPIKYNDMYIVFGEVVTQKLLVDEYLAQKLETLSMYLEFAPVFFIVLDKEGNIDYINSWALHKTGHTFGEVIRKNWFDIFVPDEIRDNVKKVFQKIMSGEIELVQTYENEILTKDGTQIVILWENKLILKDGKPAGSISVGVDITEKKIRYFEEEVMIDILSLFSEDNYQIAIKKIGNVLRNKFNVVSAYAKIISHDETISINFIEHGEEPGTNSIEETRKYEEKVIHLTIKHNDLPKYASEHCIKNVINILFSFVDRVYYIQKLEEASFKDPLTGLYNRRYFMIMLKNEVKRVKRYGFDSTVVMIDLDGLKNINDSLGHDKGDVAIKILSHGLILNTRSSDICARFGGDEFVMLLPQTNSASAKVIIDRIREFIKQTISQQKLEFEICFSAGITQILTSDDEEGIDVLKRADELLYKAKHSGKNQSAIG